MVKEAENKTNNAGYTLIVSNNKESHAQILKDGKVVKSVTFPKNWIKHEGTSWGPVDLKVGEFDNGIASVSYLIPTSNPNNFSKVEAGVTRSGAFVEPLLRISDEFTRLANMVYEDPSKLANIDLVKDLSRFKKSIEIINILCDIAIHGYEAQIKVFTDKYGEGVRSLIPSTVQEHIIQKKIAEIQSEANSVVSTFKSKNGVISRNKEEEHEM